MLALFAFAGGVIVGVLGDILVRIAHEHYKQSFADRR